MTWLDDQVETREVGVRRELTHFSRVLEIISFTIEESEKFDKRGHFEIYLRIYRLAITPPSVFCERHYLPHTQKNA